MGKLINPDNITSNPANPQSLNRCIYCLNNLLKCLLVIITLVLFIESCSYDDCQYIKWNQEWTYATYQKGRCPEISFEYPDCFQLQTKEDFIKYGPGESDVDNDGIKNQFCIIILQKFGERNDSSYNEYYKNKISEIAVILHLSAISQIKNDPENGWKEYSSGNQTFLEWYLSSRGTAVSQSTEYSESRIVVDGHPAYSFEFTYQRPNVDSPYKDRTLIMTAFEYNGVIVEFNMDSWDKEAETVKEYFNYLLDTFNIIMY